MILRERIAWGVGVVFVLGLTYLLATAAIIRDVIAPFVYATLLTVRSAMNSLPQFAVWLVFVMIVVQILSTSLIRFARAMNLKSNVSEGRIFAEPSPSPMQKYKRWVERSTQGAYFRWRVAEHLVGMTAEIRGSRISRSRPQIEQLIRQNKPAFPPHVHRYLLESINDNAQEPNWVQLQVNRLQTANYEQLAESLTFLENELGIRNQFGTQQSAENETQPAVEA